MSDYIFSMKWLAVDLSSLTLVTVTSKTRKTVRWLGGWSTQYRLGPTTYLVREKKLATETPFHCHSYGEIVLASFISIVLGPTVEYVFALDLLFMILYRYRHER